MNPTLTKIIKRRAEIAALAIGKTSRFPRPDRFGTADLANIFGVDEITIKRDLNFLRSIGVDIHSVRNRGILIDQPPADSVVRELFLEYVALSAEEVSFKASALTLAVFGQMDKVLCFILLCYCIENHLMADIRYAENDSSASLLRVCPYCLYSENDGIILAAAKYGKPDRLQLKKIKSVSPTEFKFETEMHRLKTCATLFKHNELSYSHN
jgi:predicted DNA-binding transcriptional regulator YafY